MTSQPWIQTISGACVPLTGAVNEIADQILITDVAVHLSRLNRFVGGTRVPLTVAQHSVDVGLGVFAATHNTKLALYGLLHDAHEAFTGDMPSPVKWAMGEHYAAFGVIADRLQQAIHLASGLPEPGEEIKKLVHFEDLRSLAREKRDQLVPSCRDNEWRNLPEPDPAPLIAWPGEMARLMFLEYYHKWAREIRFEQQNAPQPVLPAAQQSQIEYDSQVSAISEVVKWAK